MHLAADPMQAMIDNLNVLVVDDTPENVLVLTTLLGRMGHAVMQARSGEEALDLFRRHRPDMVLMDVMMPGIDGYETVREMRRIAEEWLPIIFVTVMGNSDDIVQGIEAGGDEYLIKPIDFKILQVKIHSLIERLHLVRKLAEQNRLLQDYQAHNEEDQRIALGYMQQLIALDKLHDPAVQFYLKSAENFCGDLIAVARTPGGQLHVMLADSTGHGLPAALAGMPAIQTFYSMTEKGFGISAVAREMNNKVRHSLSVSHFVAAILVSVDPVDRMFKVWNGGCPPPVMLNGDGEKVYQFIPRHLALGILQNDEFDATVEHYSCQDHDCSLFMFSKGVIELENRNGEQIGLERLLLEARSSAAPDRWQNMKAAIEKFPDGKAATHDDIAMMIVQCLPEKEPEQKQKQGQEINLEPGQGQVAWQFSLSLTMRQIRSLDVVPLLLDVVNQIESDSKRGGEIFLILSELFNNALDHGLLKLDSSLKHHPDGMDKYFDERTERMASVQVGQIDMSLEKLVYAGEGALLKIRVRDSGEGFDYRRAGALPVTETQRHGRGIVLLNNLCNSVRFLGNGSEVMVHFELPP